MTKNKYSGNEKIELSHNVTIDLFYEQIIFLFHKDKEAEDFPDDTEEAYFSAKTNTIHLKATEVINIGALAHEIFHAVHSMLDRLGIVLSDDSEEIYAYMIDYTLREVLDFCKDNKLKTF